MRIRVLERDVMRKMRGWRRRGVCCHQRDLVVGWLEWSGTWSVGLRGSSFRSVEERVKERVKDPWSTKRRWRASNLGCVVVRGQIAIASCAGRCPPGGPPRHLTCSALDGRPRPLPLNRSSLLCSA